MDERTSDSDGDYDFIEPTPIDRFSILLEAAKYVAALDSFHNAKKKFEVDFKLIWRFLNFDSHPAVTCSIESLNQTVNVFVEVYCGSDLLSAEKVPTYSSRHENKITFSCDMKVVESAVMYISKTVETIADLAARYTHLDKYRIRLVKVIF